MTTKGSELIEEKRAFDKLMKFMQSKDEEPETFLELQLKLRKNKQLARMTNLSGYSPLHVGIQMEAAWKKLAMLLVDKEVAKQRNPAGRLPLHMALDYYPKQEMLVSLIDLHPTAVKEWDVDMRLPLHIVLEYQPFSSHFTDIAMRMLGIYPYAAKVKYNDGRLPLHMALDRTLPGALVLKVFHCDRSAAGVARRDGKYPLHLALENDVEADIVAQLMEAHPKALTIKMSLFGHSLLPMEFAIKKLRGTSVIKTLVHGGDSDNPAVLAYARAVTAGRIGKEMRAEGCSRGGKALDATDILHMRRTNGMLVMEREDESNPHPEEQNQVRCLLRSDEGLLLTVVCSNTDKVEDLRLAVQAAESRALRLQDLEPSPPDDIRLMLGGTQLMDGRTLASYGITKECMLGFRQRFEVLHEALRVRLQDDILRELLQLRPQSAREDDANGCLPLHIAIMNNASDQMVKQLIDGYPQATTIPVEGTLGQYCLHIALKAGYPFSVIEHLLQAKGNSVKESDWTREGLYNPSGMELDPDNTSLPLHMAISCSDKASVKSNIMLMLESKCPITARDKATGYTAAECALATKGADDLFRFVLTHAQQTAPLSLTEESPTGQLLLHVACASGASTGIFQTLVDLNPHALFHYDTDGRQPIHLALMSPNSFPTIRLLLERMLEERRKKRGRREAEQKKTVRDVLRRAGQGSEEIDADEVFQNDGAGRSPLQLAVMHHAAPGVVHLINRLHPQAIKVRDSKGQSPIHLAVACDAPSWILHELFEADPRQVMNISILKGSWPNTRAASEVMKMIGGHTREDNNSWQTMLVATTTKGQRAPPAVVVQPEAIIDAEQGAEKTVEELQPALQDEAACQYTSCCIT